MELVITNCEGPEVLKMARRPVRNPKRLDLRTAVDAPHDRGKCKERSSPGYQVQVMPRRGIELRTPGNALGATAIRPSPKTTFCDRCRDVFGRRDSERPTKGKGTKKNAARPAESKKQTVVRLFNVFTVQ